MNSHFVTRWLFGVLFFLGCGTQQNSQSIPIGDRIESPAAPSTRGEEAKPITADVRAFAAQSSEPATNNANIINGRVVGVADGDTVTVLDATKTQHKIRLEGIDAPESHQAFGTQSKHALSTKIFDKDVRVEWKSKDKYRRTLGHIYLDDRWINKDMVEEGWAWHYRQYSNDEDLANAEKTARAGEAGLWKDAHPIAPWDFRHNPALAESVPADATTVDPTATTKKVTPEEITVYVTQTGGKYHRNGCRYLSKSKIAISLDDAKHRYGACSVCNPPR